MGDKSNISWTDATWNPTTGCSHVSDGCTHCYAETLSLRHGWSKKPWTKPNAHENVVLHPDRLTLPLTWKTPRRVFVDSMSDLFHEEIPDEFIDKVFAVMSICQRHIFQVLTKRPARMLEYFNERWQVPGGGFEFRCDQVADEAFRLSDDRKPEHWTPEGNIIAIHNWPLPNVWLGVSVEDQRRADERIPLLLQTPAAMRFLSCEPLLGPVDLGSLAWVSLPRLVHGDWPVGHHIKAGAGIHRAYVNPHGAVSAVLDGPDGDLGIKPDEMDWCRKINWVIVGGESGPNHRPMDLDWARSIRDQCQAAGVPLWFKQSGGARPGTGEELDGRIWHEFPEVSR